jgi:hypothetical protein
MRDYSHGSHTVFSIHLRMVWIAKYRRTILRLALNPLEWGRASGFSRHIDRSRLVEATAL